MNTLIEARRLYELGFAILVLQSKSKRPKAMKWTSGPRSSWEEVQRLYNEGDNIGVRTGEPSKVGGYYLACIDVDVKSPAFKGQALKELKELIGGVELAPEVSSGSGNGSRHIYCLTKKPFKMITVSKNENYEICIYSNGRQMVLPPSIHPSGRRYKWTVPVKTKADLPVINFKIPEVTEMRDKPTKNGRSTSHFSFTPVPVDIDWLEISKSTLEGMKTGLGIEDRSAFLLTAVMALISCDLDRDEILSVLTNPKYFISSAASERRGKDRQSQAEWLWSYTVSKVMEERNTDKLFTHAKDVVEKKLSKEEAAKQSKEFSEELNWQQDLDRTQHGKTKPTLKNLNIILTNSVEGALFKKDMFANRIAYGVDSPWGPKANEYIQDIDATLIKHWLGTGPFNIEPSREALFEATDLIAHRERTHPVREWLESLKWDKKPRIDTWIKDYCQAEAEEPYLSEVSRKFLLAMVKRIFEPGCQWDYTLVLEGDQGKYKSTIARTLASDKWFMDNLPDLRDKDAMLNLQGKWLIELGELTNVKRSDFNLVKQYLIRRIDTVRPHYGRIMSDVPRQSVFIGTVNDGQYLKDPTGNRRFWPVKVGTCDVAGLKKVREQLFAEAFEKYQKEKLMLSPDATAQAVEAQDDRRIDDDNVTMEEALKEYRESEAGKSFDFGKFKARDLFFGPNAPWGAWNNKNYAFQTASQVLKNMGFIRKKVKGQRVWISPEIGGQTVGQGGRPLLNGHTQKGAGGQTGGRLKTGGVPPTIYEEDFY